MWSLGKGKGRRQRAVSTPAPLSVSGWDIPKLGDCGHEGLAGRPQRRMEQEGFFITWPHGLHLQPHQQWPLDQTHTTTQDPPPQKNAEQHNRENYQETPTGAYSIPVNNINSPAPNLPTLCLRAYFLGGR